MHRPVVAHDRRNRLSARPAGGSVAVLTATLIVVASVCCVLLLEVGMLSSKRALASAAADAAALAAASELALGQGEQAATREAQHFASVNGARLDRCACSGNAAEVTVTLVINAFGIGTFHARARAIVDFTRA